MQSGLTPVSILQQARVVFAEPPLPAAAVYSAINKDIDFFITLFEADAQGTLPQLPLEQSPEAAAIRFRANLMRELLPVPYPSAQDDKIDKALPRDQYNAIHNALLLLGQYFPVGLGKGEINPTCCITTEEINENEFRFVLASGHTFSIAGICQLVSNDWRDNPINHAPISERDWLRMRLLYNQTNLRCETHACGYAGGGMLFGMFYITLPLMGMWAIACVVVLILAALGVIHFPSLLTMALLPGPDMLNTFEIVAFSVEFMPAILGFMIGAILGLINKTPDSAMVHSINDLKGQIGDVLENSTLKKLNYHFEPEAKENKKESQDDLMLNHLAHRVNLRISRVCPNFFKNIQLDEASLAPDEQKITNIKCKL